jgi:hypothetical protein
MTYMGNIFTISVLAPHLLIVTGYFICLFIITYFLCLFAVACDGLSYMQRIPSSCVQSTGYFKICKSNNSDQCPNKNISANKLPYRFPSNYGYGIFGFQADNLVTNSTWIADVSNQLLIYIIGPNYFYFNRTGYFTEHFNFNQCTWSAACNYQCEIYNYNSRFLDYAGQWIITKKWGIGDVQSIAVQAWIENAINAAGVSPIILYLDMKTGHYIGLDKLDTIGSSTMVLHTSIVYTTTQHQQLALQISTPMLQKLIVLVF